MNGLDAAAIAALMRRQIRGYGGKISQEETGGVISVSDGIVRAAGLEKCMANEVVLFPEGVKGIALNLEEEYVSIALLGGGRSVREGSEVRRSGELLYVPAGEGLLGRVVDALGQPIDGRGTIKAVQYAAVEAPAPSIMDRKRVQRPLETGIKTIDCMVPVGKGQRELIIGDRQTGKTTIAVDTIIHQRGKDVICIYAAIGQKQSTVAETVQQLKETGAMEYSIVVSATASEAPALQYIAPYSACAMAEYFMRSGRDVLIIYDDLSKHAVAYRALSLLIRRPPGREAYPGDIFYLHSRLLERAGQLSDALGGGSITALPIVETQSGDVSAYIPTNVISITDGQIFLESEMFRSGIKPAVNPGISVSRVGGSAQIPAMRRLAGKIRIMYSQYRELKSFAQFGADLDGDTKRRIEQGRRMVEVLRQPKGAAVDTEKQVVLLYALVNDYLDDVPPEKVQLYEKLLYEYLDGEETEMLGNIRKTGEIDEEKLKNALEEFGRQFALIGAEQNGR